jgi:hypothetical protein
MKPEINLRDDQHFAANLAKYDITPSQYIDLFMEQGGVCAVCQKPEEHVSSKNGRTQRLSVDHDHVTGKVRGLLCHACNVMLGYAKDNPEVLLSAIMYLRRTP